MLLALLVLQLSHIVVIFAVRSMLHMFKKSNFVYFTNLIKPNKNPMNLKWQNVIMLYSVCYIYNEAMLIQPSPTEHHICHQHLSIDTMHFEFYKKVNFPS